MEGQTQLLVSPDQDQISCVSKAHHQSSWDFQYFLFQGRLQILSDHLTVLQLASQSCPVPEMKPFLKMENCSYKLPVHVQTSSFHMRLVQVGLVD